jgi:hypothetical protein
MANQEEFSFLKAFSFASIEKGRICGVDLGSCTGQEPAQLCSAAQQGSSAQISSR